MRMVDPRTDKVAYDTGFLPRLWSVRRNYRATEILNVQRDARFLQMAIHGGINSYYGSLYHRPILELNSHLFAIELLQKLDELHRGGRCWWEEGQTIESATNVMQ